MVGIVIIVVVFVAIFLGITHLAYDLTMSFWDEKILGERPPSFIAWGKSINVCGLLCGVYKFNLTAKIRHWFV